jgi:general secretion pathway protein M
MMAALQRWWGALSRREKRLVAVAAALALGVLAWLLLRPLFTYLSGLDEAHRDAVERAARVEAKALLLKSDARGDSPITSGPLDAWLTQSAGDMGLTLDRNEARGQAAATIAVSSARAPALVGWLARLEGQGLVIDRLALTPGPDGSVALTAEVRRP